MDRNFTKRPGTRGAGSQGRGRGSDRGGFGDRPERGGFGDRPERGGFGDRPERGGGFGDRPERGGGFGDRPERGGGFGDRPRGGGFGDRPRGGGFGDRPRGGGFGDRPRGGGFGDRPRGGGFGDRPRGGGFGDRPRGGGFGDRPRGGGFGDRPRGGGFGDRPRGGGFGDRPRGGGFGDRPRGGGFGDRPRGGGFGDRPRGGGFGDRPRGGGFGDRPQRGGFGDRPDRGGFDDRPNYRDNNNADGGKPRRRAPRGDRGEGTGDYYLYGFHAVGAALYNHERVKTKLLLTVEAKERLEKNPALKSIIADLPVELVERYDLDQLLDNEGQNVVHQGVALLTAPLPHVDLRHFLETQEKMFDEKKGPTVIMVLERLQDPHNIGAIVRSAAYFGVAAIVLPERHSPSETPLLAKAASGGLESLPIIRVANIAESLRLLKKHGFWIYGLGQRGQGALHQTTFDKKAVLLLGQEGSGLSPLAQSLSDFSIRIDGAPLSAAVPPMMEQDDSDATDDIDNHDDDNNNEAGDQPDFATDTETGLATTESAADDQEYSAESSPNDSSNGWQDDSEKTEEEDLEKNSSNGQPNHTQKGKPQNGVQESDVDSLNVSNAAAISLFRLYQQWAG